MRISPTQRDFLSTMADVDGGELHLYQISNRMTAQLRQPTIDKLREAGLIEYGSGRKFRLTDAGREALNT